MVTPISSVGTRDYRDNKSKHNSSKEYKTDPMSFKEFLEELHMEQTEQS
jgi:hypothetical protein